MPLAYVLLQWEPTDDTASTLRGLNVAKEGLYWALIVACPSLGWVLFFPVGIRLKFAR